MTLSTGMRDRGRALAERLGASELARQAYLAELHPLCPRDGLAGTYIGLIGGDNSTGTVAHLAFTCPHHDAFAYDSQTGAVWPISASSGRRTAEVCSPSAESSGSSPASPRMSPGRVIVSLRSAGRFMAMRQAPIFTRSSISRWTLLTAPSAASAQRMQS